MYLRSVQVCHSADAGSRRLCSAIRAGTCTAPGAAQAQKGRENEITTNKNTKKKNCLRLLSNGFRVDGPRRRRFGAARGGNRDRARNRAENSGGCARGKYNITRIYIYIRINVIRTADDQYIYMRGGCQNIN